MLAALILALHPLWPSGLARAPGDVGDASFNNYLLEHTYGWVSGAQIHRELFSPPFFYPAPNAAAYSDLLLGFAPLYWPARALGASPGQAYLIWLGLCGLLNLLAAFYLLRRHLGASSGAALAGACVMVLGQSHVGNLAHPQLFPFFYVVLALCAVFAYFEPQNQDRAANSQRHQAIALFYFALAAQFYSAFYLCFFLCLGLCLALIFSQSRSDCRAALKLALKRDHAWLGLGALTALAAIYPLASRYAAVQAFYGKRDFTRDIAPLLPRLESWLNSGHSYLDRLILGPDFGLTLPGHLEQLYGPGLLCAALGLAVFWVLRRERPYYLIGLASLGIIALSTAFGDNFSLWRLVWAYAPGASGIRAVSRIGLVLSIPCALALSRLWDCGRGGAGLRALCLGLCILCLGEQLAWFESFDLQARQREVNRIAQGIAPGWQAFALGVDNPSLGYAFEHQIDAMFASSQAGIPTLNGYSGYEPADWPFINPYTPTPEARAKLEQGLASWADKYGLDRARLGIVELTGE